MRITRDQVTLKPGACRGDKIVFINGEPWAIARAIPQGSRGNAHVLRYPHGPALDVRISPYKLRQLNAPPGLVVASQENEIRDRMVTLVNSGKVKSPADRAAEVQGRLDVQRLEEERVQRLREQVSRGIMTLRKRDLTEDETVALHWLYYEAYAVPLPEAQP